MSSDRDTTRIVRSWLDEGVTELPDRVLDAVLDQLPATDQRRRRWALPRLPVMSRAMQIALASAAILAIALLGLGVFQGANVGGPGLGDPTQTPAPTPIPALLGAATEPGAFSLTPGTYLLDRPFPVRIAMTLPSGWVRLTVEDEFAGILVDNGTLDGSGWGLLFFVFEDNLFADPCDTADGVLAPASGLTVDEYITALEALPRMQATAPVDFEIDGYRGARIDLIAPSDAASCPDGGATVFNVPGWEDANYVMALGERLQFRVLDVDSTRLVIVATDYPATSAWEVRNGVAFHPSAHAAEQLELREIIDSLQIDP